MTLVHANSRIATIYFPESGVASIVSTNKSGEQTEVGIFGREGFSAASLLLGSEQTSHQTFMQIDGATAIAIGAARLRTAANESATLRDLLLRYINTFMIQTAASVVSNAHNSIETRLYHPRPFRSALDGSGAVRRRAGRNGQRRGAKADHRHGGLSPVA